MFQVPLLRECMGSDTRRTVLFVSWSACNATDSIDSRSVRNSTATHWILALPRWSDDPKISNPCILNILKCPMMSNVLELYWNFYLWPCWTFWSTETPRWIDVQDCSACPFVSLAFHIISIISLTWCWWFAEDKENSEGKSLSIPKWFRSRLSLVFCTAVPPPKVELCFVPASKRLQKTIS